MDTKLNKKLQLNKEVIAKLEQRNIFGGDAEHSNNGYKCGKSIVDATGASGMLAGTCGGVVSDNCGFTGHTGESKLGELEICWGHDCW